MTKTMDSDEEILPALGYLVAGVTVMLARLSKEKLAPFDITSVQIAILMFAALALAAGCAGSCPNAEQQAFLDEYSELRSEVDDEAATLLELYFDVSYAVAGEESVRRYLMDNPRYIAKLAVRATSMSAVADDLISLAEDAPPGLEPAPVFILTAAYGELNWVDTVEGWFTASDEYRPEWTELVHDIRLSQVEQWGHAENTISNLCKPPHLRSTP